MEGTQFNSWEVSFLCLPNDFAGFAPALLWDATGPVWGLDCDWRQRGRKWNRSGEPSADFNLHVQTSPARAVRPHSSLSQLASVSLATSIPWQGAARRKDDEFAEMKPAQVSGWGGGDLDRVQEQPAQPLQSAPDMVE